jgi:hypothetical protein
MRSANALALAAALILAAPVAIAGEARCATGAPETVKVERAAVAAVRLEHALHHSGAALVLIARIGADVSRHGLRYTHAGFAWRDDPAGRWTVRHALNDCGSASSRLYSQGLMNFFLDDPLSYEAMVLVPHPALAARIVERLRSGASEALHVPAYSTIAYPFATRYQNSNQYVLENLALAHAPLAGRAARANTRAEAIAELRQSGYVPSTIRVGALERIGAGTRANIRFDDHPREADASSRYELVTVESIEAWFARNGLLSARRVVPP